MKPDKLKLSFIKNPGETERKKRVTKLVAQMVCDYVKTQNNRKPEQHTNTRLQQQIETNKLLLENFSLND